MGPPGSSVDRGVSPVVGTILLVGMFTILVSMIGFIILTGGPVTQAPDVEVSIHEDDDGTVYVVVTDPAGLSGTELEVYKEGTFVENFGDASIEPGDMVEVDGSNGEQIQVVYTGGQAERTVIASYEVQN